MYYAMQIAMNRTMRSLKSINLNAVVAIFAFFILLFMLVYRWYMKIEYGRLEKKITEKNVELDARKNDLSQVQKNPWYLKLLASKYLEEKTRPVNREQSLRYLTQLLEELKQYNKNKKWVDLAHFQIDSKKITLQWRVSGLKDIYAEWGIIDSFTNYPFIKFFDVPYYRKIDEEQKQSLTNSIYEEWEEQAEVIEWYEFSLDADIFHYDWTEPTS